MARIPTFDAGEGALHPSDLGATALREAGVMTTRMGNQAAADVRRTGQQLGSGIASIGAVIGGIEEKAQEHTDNMANIDAMNAITKSEVAALGGVSDAGTPKDSTGEPITSHPGRGGDDLPLDASVPNREQFATVASNAHSQQAELGQGIVERAAAQGASKKQQDHIAAEVARSQNRLAVHSATIAAEVDINHALHSTATSTNTIIAGVDQDPTQLPNSLEQLNHLFGEKGGSMTGLLGLKGAEKADEMRGTARELAVTTAIEATARKGDVVGAKKIMDAYPDIVGSKREHLQTEINRLGNESDQADNRKEALQIKRDHAAMDLAVGQARAAGKPMPDLARTDLGIKYPEKVTQLEHLWAANENADLHRLQPDPVASFKNAEPIRQQAFGGNPDEALEAARKAYADPATPEGQRIGKKDYDEIRQLVADPTMKSAAKNAHDWLSQEGYRKLDPLYDPAIRTTAGDQQIRKWQEDYNARVQADPAHARDLLDRTKPGNMVSKEALDNYRVTEQLRTKVKAEEGNRDTAAAKAQGLYEPSFWERMFGGDKPATPALAPIKTEADVQKLGPGTKFIVPDGPHKGETRMVPQKMNFAPEAGIGNAASGAIDAHTDKNLFSSGRARTMGVDGGVGKNLAQVSVQGHSIQVNAQAAPHFDGFLKELTERGYKITDLGGYSPRGKVGGFGGGYSEHAYGNAIDINPNKNPQSGGTDLPNDIGHLAEKYGLIWGGDWTGRSRDPMHFEWSGKDGTKVAGA